MTEDFDNAHYLLAQALKAADPAVRPSAPFHGGGPQPKLDGYGYLKAALWLAERARPDLDARDEATFERWIDLAQQELASQGEDTARRFQLNQAEAKKVSRIPLKMGVWAASEAAYFGFRSIYSGTAARFAAAGWTKHLSKVAPEAVRAYLIELERLCVHLEALCLVRDKKLTVSQEPVETLWRGWEDKRVTHFLSRIDDGRWLLVRKAGTRWMAIEGNRDDVLASVDEAHFSKAVAKVLNAPPPVR